MKNKETTDKTKADERLPGWIKIKRFEKEKYIKTLKIIKENKINTVCIEANCPNRYECFSSGTATFMILGNVCTRKCLYCNISSGKPDPVDDSEAKRVRNAVKMLKLDYVVVTCVARDDLEDGGAEQFVNVVNEIRMLGKEEKREIKIELLISDFNGNFDALDKVIKSKPEVINHNIEAVESIFGKVRPKGSYNLSLGIIKRISESGTRAKSGFMVGLGEGIEDIKKTLHDLRENGCDIVTVGQYLRPSEKNIKVKKYYSPKEFEKIAKLGKNIGLKVIAGPLVRSSYKAKDSFNIC